ncbi:class XI myosin heavy chain MyoD [Volvox carteri f. nagariensis]|uniref:Class XI myosin heavy chain MyoD n=1 Tax=Volvox carteri f. nagariensis TaxID=3068 RepID=D8TPI2_VOLCA|nr:class XI myosin heavy chain MyoD [Volvox carteri f. nagariensis]EFJ50770.1 class XI myosin heavy chain MyoD [Volvox carteri f. nagariensis]|eukprot:XP_002948363.1 class XI myosin heavy chain MyoD [Volvox carteri f. nagariensis]
MCDELSSGLHRAFVQHAETIKNVQVLEAQQHETCNPTVSGRSTSIDLGGRESPKSISDMTEADADRLLVTLKALLLTPSSSGQRTVDGSRLAGIRFHRRLPTAAILVFRYCLLFRAFQASRTAIFDQLAAVISQQVNWGQSDNECLAYWLSNTVVLHILFKDVRRASSHVDEANTDDWMSLPCVRSQKNSSYWLKQLVAKYPALLFKHQLAVIVETTFSLLRANVRKEISLILEDCILTPKASSGSTVARTGATVAQQADPSKAWTELLRVLDTLLGVAEANYVAQVLVEVADWTRERCPKIAGSLEEFEHLRQAATFLLLTDKQSRSLEEITKLYPRLSIQQLYRLSYFYLDDKGETQTVSPRVLHHMQQVMEDSNIIPCPGLLQVENLCLPFQTIKLLSSLDNKDLYVNLHASG